MSNLNKSGSQHTSAEAPKPQIFTRWGNPVRLEFRDAEMVTLIHATRLSDNCERSYFDNELICDDPQYLRSVLDGLRQDGTKGGAS